MNGDPGEETPEWLAHLEQPKLFHLAHEYGSGAPCYACEYCSGLELHFWRKICMVCGCDLNDHAVNNEGFPQYRVIFGERKNINEPVMIPFEGRPTWFDWAPDQLNDEFIEEYMSCLPDERRPIRGSVGSQDRKVQLGRQLPRYDADRSVFPLLTEEEERAFKEYKHDLKVRASGVGSVTKINSNSDGGIYRANVALVYEQAESEIIESKPQFTADCSSMGKLFSDMDFRPNDSKISARCHRCCQPIQDNTIIVSASKLEGSVWHANCFCCHTCEELLVDLYYFYHNGNVYCGRDYAKAANKHRCFACDEIIFEKEFTCANGNFYHMRHFCCFVCDGPLGGKQFIHKNDNILCLQCYQNKFPQVCATCQRCIAVCEHRIKIGGRVYHKSEDCFVCHICSKSIQNSRILLVDSRLSCSSCLEKRI